MSKMPDKMPLHYTSVTELLEAAKVNWKGKKPSDVCKRLPEMYNLARADGRKGDEEKQYIFLWRWLNCIEWLKSTQEYKDDKSVSLKNMHVNQINEARQILADLKKGLDARYKLKLKGKIIENISSTEKMDVDNEPKMNFHKSRIDGPIKLPETPTRDPLVSDNEEIINCDQLFQIIQKGDNRYLIIDIRYKLEYDSSRILSDKSVNIPKSEINRGAVTSHFEDYLRKDKESLYLFRHRGAQYVDVIILLDWDTPSETLSSDNHLNILRKILEDWDPGIKYKRITILDGGYAGWITRYPAFTTNPNIVEPASNNVPDETLDNIDYPDWIHLNEEENATESRDNKSINVKPVNKNEAPSKATIANDKLWYKHMETETSNNMLLNNLMGAEVVGAPQNNTMSRQYDSKRMLSITKKNERTRKPTVDRSSKPVTLDASNSESKVVLKLMKQLTELAKDKERLDEDILEQERTLFMQQGNKYKSTNDEEYIRGNVKSLCLKLEEKQNEYKIIEDELNKYNIESIKFNSEEKTAKGYLVFNLNMLKRNMKATSADRKKLREKCMKNSFKESSVKENENNIYKEPLKMDSNSSVGCNLERSYSSPNLFQIIDRKAPQVDRSSKPQVSSYNQNESYSDNKVSHLSWANREERMTPVHGSVVRIINFYTKILK